MKRIVCILFAMALLCCVSFAEETAEPCQHEYEKHPFLINEVRKLIQEYYPDDSEAFYGYALCKLCSDMPLLVIDPNMLEADPCEPDECIHRLYLLPEFNHAVWRSVTDEGGHTYHERVEYDVSVCMDCNLVVTLFEIMESGEHQMEEKQGFHIEGQYIHVTCEECLLCGLMTGALVPCVSYEDGTCDRLPAR